MLHAVNGGKFGIALFGLPEQKLRFIEETCVFEGHTHVG